MNACAVLHVTSIPGGGVDRHVRDISASGRRRHLVWHVGEAADAIERPEAPRVMPLDRDALQRDPAVLGGWLRAQGVGVVHLHSVARHARARAEWAASATGASTVVTLHDVLFLDARGFIDAVPGQSDPAWLAEVKPLLLSASAVVAPSRYIADLAERHVGRAVEVVPNGMATKPPRTLSPRPEFDRPRWRRVIAVLGAIGPHKGARLLEELAPRFAGTDTAVVVIGYMDRQNFPGWYRDHLFLHGPYDSGEAADWLRAYRADVVLFPPGVPESFGYALSEAWTAGVPVVVPPIGALAERVRAHGGGWLLPADADAAAVHRVLQSLDTADGRAQHAQVKSALETHDRARIPPLDAMNDSLEALYKRFGVDPAGPVDPLSAPAQSLLATHLDTGLFRAELIWVTELLALEQQRAAAAAREAARFETEARAWIAKLEKDVSALQQELRAEVARRERLENPSLRQRIAWLMPPALRGVVLGKPDARD